MYEKGITSREECQVKKGKKSGEGRERGHNFICH